MANIGTGTHVFAVCRSNRIKHDLCAPIMRWLRVIMDTYLDLILVCQPTDHGHEFRFWFRIDYLDTHGLGKLEDLCPLRFVVTIYHTKCTEFHPFFLECFQNRDRKSTRLNSSH